MYPPTAVPSWLLCSASPCDTGGFLFVWGFCCLFFSFGMLERLAIEGLKKNLILLVLMNASFLSNSFKPLVLFLNARLGYF